MLHVPVSNTRHLVHTSIKSLSPLLTINKPTTKQNETFEHLHNILKKCSNIKHIQQTHTQILYFNGLSTIFLPSKLISLYSKHNHLSYAQNVFKHVPNETLFNNTLIWNSILRANVNNLEYVETIQIYKKMKFLGVLVDGYSFPLVIRACAIMGHSYLCDLVYGHVILTGFQDYLDVVNEFLVGYGKVGEMGVARKLFDGMSVRSCVSWNSLVSGFALNCDCEGAVGVFRRMEREGWEANEVTWTSLLSSYARCGRFRETLRLYNVMRCKGVRGSGESVSVVVSVCHDSDVFDKGQELHGYVVTGGFENYSFAKNSLLCMYGRYGNFEAAEKLFSEIETKSLVSWNALISVYAQVGLCDEALSTLLKLQNSEKYIVPNVISWSAIISGFASNGRSNESLDFFRKMQLAKVKPNVVTLSSLLSVCAELSTIYFGKEIHTYILRNLMDTNLLVYNGLINMYSKCGCLKDAHIAFKNIQDKDLCSYNTMIKGYGMHGHGESALKIFTQMIDDGYSPDGVTFVTLLSACSHTGLVSEGRKLFDQIKTEFGIEPEIEHYACMVDLFGRAGLFQEASEVAKRMPIKPNVCVWGSLLNSSRMHKNVDWDEGSVKKILNVSSATGNYMLLSNIYAESGQWENSAKVRVSARERGLTKTPGQSWIEVDKRVHMFTAGEFVESEIEEVQMLLKILSFQMKIEGYGLCSSS